MILPAAILAGGLSRRMGGGDKCLLPLGHGTVLDHVLARLRPQARPIMLNANSDPSRFARFDLTICPDSLPGFLGPLAGILTAMRWAARMGAAQVATVAADMPFVPCDLIARLAAAARNGGIVIAEADGKRHPVTAVWPVNLADRLEQDLNSGQRRVSAWLDGIGFAALPFTDQTAFHNLNHAGDWLSAARHLALRQQERAGGADDHQAPRFCPPVADTLSAKSPAWKIRHPT